MSYLGNEETLVELPAVEYLVGQLGYNVLHGRELTPDKGVRDSLTEVVLTDRLVAAIKKLNPGLMKAI